MADASNDKGEGTGKMGVIKTLVLPLALLAVVGGGAGFAFGQFAVAPKIAAGTAAVETTDDAHSASGTEEEHAADENGAAAPVSLVDLPPILTNMVSPADVWLRVELSLGTPHGLSDDTVEAIHQDFFNFLRTLSLDQLNSQSVFLRVKSSLLERARTRAGDDAISSIYIRTMLYE